MRTTTALITSPDLTFEFGRQSFMDATIISPTLLEKEIEDIEGSDLEFDEDVFSLEEESKKMTKREEDLVENIDKEIETSIVNITRKGVNK